VVSSIGRYFAVRIAALHSPIGLWALGFEPSIEVLEIIKKSKLCVSFSMLIYKPNQITPKEEVINHLTIFIFANN
jgi:hypothetical protein